MNASEPKEAVVTEQESAMASISRAMVAIYKEQLGRGPTRTRTDWCSADVITCVLEDTLTPAEIKLAGMGEHQRLRDTRRIFQYASVREFCESVELATGRRVRAFINGIDTEVRGLSVETFALHPIGSDEPRASTRAATASRAAHRVRKALC